VAAIHIFCVMGPDALCCVRLGGFLPLLVRLLGEDASGICICTETFIKDSTSVSSLIFMLPQHLLNNQEYLVSFLIFI
jgi:hypothetical protein